MSVEKSYREASGFISQLFNTAISVLKVLIRSKSGTPLPQVQGGTCIVLGNGPSLKKSLQDHHGFFKKHPLICVNSFSITEHYTDLQPTYYVILDPGFWLGSGELVDNTLEGIRTKTTWPIYLLVPPRAKQSELFSNLEKQNTNITIIHFNYTVFKGFKNIAHYFYRKNLAMPQSQNVLVASLFLGLNIGFKKMFVVGADHSWHEHLHISDDNMLCVKQIHFYDNEEKVTYTPFYKGLHSKDVFKIDEILLLFAKTFHGYMVLNEYARTQSCEILNASEVSFIDAFKRIKLRDDSTL